MIASVHRGGLGAIATLLFLAVSVHILHFYNTFYQGGPTDIEGHFMYLPFTIPTLIYQILIGFIIVIQGIWFSNLMNRYQFFEQRSMWPFVSFLMLCVVYGAQFLNLNVLIFNFVFLYIYQRIFSISEDEMSDYQLYMDVGTVYALGLLWLPEGVFLLPVFMLTINQFAVFDINRLLLFLLSVLMVLLPAITLTYLFLSRIWAQSFIDTMIAKGFSFIGLWAPEVLYPYIAILVVLMLFVPTINTQLGFMQNQNRKIFNVMLIHLVTGLLMVVLSNISKPEALMIIGIPIAFLFAFGSGHLRSRLLANILIIMLLFTFIFIQWVYVFNKTVV